MAEVLFYRLTSTPLEATLPEMLEKSLDRGWRVLLRAGSAAGLEFLDERLWTYRDDAFLPHGRAVSPHAARQPILLTIGGDNVNDAHVLMLALGARAEPEELGRYARACVIFDGGDDAALATARDDWRAVVAAGLPAKYWAQEDGRWTQKTAG